MATSSTDSRRLTGRDLVLALGVGVVLVVGGFAAADKPPPAGFVAYLAAVAVLVGLLMLALPRWRENRLNPRCRSPRSPWVQGALAGLVLYLLGMLMPFSGTAGLGFWDYAIGAAATASVFAAGAAVLARLA